MALKCFNRRVDDWFGTYPTSYMFKKNKIKNDQTGFAESMVQGHDVFFFENQFLFLVVHFPHVYILGCGGREVASIASKSPDICSAKRP
jgi:hypothetical protein